MRFSSLAFAVGLCCATSATADARPVSKGYYAEVGLGATAFVGPHKDHARIGPSFAMRGGRDLFSWLSVGLYLETSSHEATVPPPPEGEYFQLYSGGAEARLGATLGRFVVFADGSVGGAMISSNILAKVAVLEPGERFALRISAGGGIEYQLQNRHYALGIASQWFTLPQFDKMTGVSTRAYLRYTY